MTETAPMAEWQVWLWDMAPEACSVYFWLLMTGGFVVSVLLARTLRNRGFYLVAIFFLSPVFTWGMRELQYQIHREAIDNQAAEQNRKIQSGEIIPYVESEIRFPVFETLLVIGLTMALRASRKPNAPAAPLRGLHH